MKTFKTISVLIAVPLFLAVFSGCASAPQKAAVRDVASINPLHDYDSEIAEMDSHINEELCYIIMKPGFYVVNIDGKGLSYNIPYYTNTPNVFIAAPGEHNLIFKFATQYAYSNPVPMYYNLEKGKYYQLDGEFITDKVKNPFAERNTYVKFFINEIVDSEQLINAEKLVNEHKARIAKNKPAREIEKQKNEAFEAYMAANPAVLEGTWTGGNVKPLEFTGNSVTCNYSGMIFKGTFVYNENTIIISWHAMKHPWNKNETEYNPPLKDTWYYQFRDGNLHILYGKKESGANLKGKLSKAGLSQLAENTGRQDLAYSMVNPDLLEGNWIDKKGNSLLFSGDTVVYNGKYFRINAIIEGTFFYNENTIITEGVQGKLGSLNIAKDAIGPKNIWYYKLNDSTLVILKGKWGKAYKVKGTYIKQ